MASLVLTGDTSGQVTIAAPAVAGTNTLTLPALTGTILTNKTAGTVLQVQQNQVTGRQTGANAWSYTTSALGSPTSTTCLLYTSPSPRDGLLSRMPSSA